MSYIISTDSSCDVYKSKLLFRSVPFIPLKYTIDGQTYEDRLTNDEDAVEFYNHIDRGAMPTTDYITIAEHKEFFENLINMGYTDILHLSISSGLSPTYEHAVEASLKIMEANPNVQIIVIDTLSTTYGHCIILEEALRLRDKNTSLKECAVDLNIFKDYVNHWIYVDDLNHLKRGGKVNGISAFVGSLLNLKPILYINRNGKLVPNTKQKGTEKSISYIIDRLVDEIDTKTSNVVYISHSNDEEKAKKTEALIKKEFPKIETRLRWIGPVIGSHTGKGVICVTFVGKHIRKK